MGRRFVAIASVASLVVGLSTSPHIDRAIQAYLKSKGLEEWGTTYCLLWGAVYVILVALVVLLVLAACWCFSALERRRARKTRAKEEAEAQRDREQKRLSLQKVLDTADDITKVLDMASNELFMETLFDNIAMDRLQEIAKKCEIVVRKAREAIMGKGTQVYAPRIGMILQSVTRHTNQEIVCIFIDSEGRSERGARKKVAQAIWGVRCVRLLIEQLQDTVMDHRLYVRQGAA